MKYRTRALQVTAHQWLATENEWQAVRDAFGLEDRQMAISGRELSIQHDGPAADTVVHYGEWVLRDGAGVWSVMNADEFERRYALVKADA